MISNKPIKAMLAAAVVTVSSSNFCQAAVMTTSSSFDIYDAASSGANVGGATDSLYASDSINLARFDGSLGTLNFVTLRFYSVRQTSYGTANYRDDDWLNETAGLTRLQNMRVYSNNLFGIGSYNQSLSSRSATCSDTGGLRSGAACSAGLSSSTRSLSGWQLSSSNASVLANLTGSGSISSSIYQDGQLYTNETDGDDGYVTYRSGDLRSYGYVSLSYDYTPVPLPATAWLFTTSLITLAGIGRKRKQIYQ